MRAAADKGAATAKATPATATATAATADGGDDDVVMVDGSSGEGAGSGAGQAVAAPLLPAGLVEAAGGEGSWPGGEYAVPEVPHPPRDKGGALPAWWRRYCDEALVRAVVAAGLPARPRGKGVPAPRVVEEVGKWALSEASGTGLHRRVVAVPMAEWAPGAVEELPSIGGLPVARVVRTGHTLPGPYWRGSVSDSPPPAATLQAQPALESVVDIAQAWCATGGGGAVARCGVSGVLKPTAAFLPMLSGFRRLREGMGSSCQLAVWG